jgi:hypothetical protein
MLAVARSLRSLSAHRVIIGHTVSQQDRLILPSFSFWTVSRFDQFFLPRGIESNTQILYSVFCREIS